MIMETRELIWLELMKYYGIMEVPGPLSNSIIMEWFKEFGYTWVKDDSDIAWCSLAINVAAKRAGLEYTNKLDARSWMLIGKPITEPQIGHVVIFWRGKKSGWTGHVGLFAGFDKDKTWIFVLGGNQANQINIKAFLINSFNFGLLGYRELYYI